MKVRNWLRIFRLPFYLIFYTVNIWGKGIKRSIEILTSIEDQEIEDRKGVKRLRRVNAVQWERNARGKNGKRRKRSDGGEW